MRDAPDPPCKGAAQLDAPEIDDCLALADLRQAAGMLVAERSERAAAQPGLDRVGDITSLLFGRRCDAGDRLSVGTVDRNGIADRKNIGMAGHGEVGQHLTTAGAAGGYSEDVRR